jgi:hypothetical protein
VADRRDDILRIAAMRKGILIDGAWKHPQTGSSGHFGSFEFRREGTKSVSLATSLDLSYPPPALLVKVYPSIFGGGPGLTRHVLAVLSACCTSQVRPSIVELISVDMVAFQSIASMQAQQFTMKTDCPDLLLPIRKNVRFCPYDVTVKTQRPTPLIGPSSVRHINERMSSNRSALCVERHTSEAVFKNLYVTGAASRDVETCLGMVNRPSALDISSASEKVGTAMTTGTRNGTLLRHRLSPVGGVMPPAGDTVRGHVYADILP